MERHMWHDHTCVLLHRKQAGQRLAAMFEMER